MTRVALLLFLPVVVLGQPFVYYRGVVNAGSFLPPGLPNGAIARGSMFTVFGRNLGPAVPQQVSAFPLQPVFFGVSVELTQGTTKVNALPVFVSATQLNLIMPSNTPLGAVSLRVIYNGQSGNPIPITLTSSSVGLFSANGGGFGPGIVQNFISDSSQPINSLNSSARQGQTEILWGTGLGAAPFPDSVAPTPTNLDTTLELYVGGKKANVAYAGRTPCCASIDQIVFTVPADAPSGCYVPVVVRTRGGIVSNTVTMAIHPAGEPCTDAHNPLSNHHRSGGKSAVVQLARENLRVDVRVTRPFEVVVDHLLATFRDTTPSSFYFSALTAPPPLGTCTVYGGSANRIFTSGSAFGPPGTHVNPGSPLKVEAGSSTANVTSSDGFAGDFYALLGAKDPLTPPAPPPLLTGGPFTLSSQGSLVASAFRAVLDNVSPMNWTNRDQVREIDRTKDLLLTWAAVPGTSRGVVITGFSESTSTNAISGFVCMAQAGAGSFSVPSYVLAALPASGRGNNFTSTQVSLANVPIATSMEVSGFDHNFLGVSFWSTKTAVTK